jgi:hypothetical protein
MGAPRLRCEPGVAGPAQVGVRAGHAGRGAAPRSVSPGARARRELRPLVRHARAHRAHAAGGPPHDDRDHHARRPLAVVDRHPFRGGGRAGHARAVVLLPGRPRRGCPRHPRRLGHGPRDRADLGHRALRREDDVATPPHRRRAGGSGPRLQGHRAGSGRGVGRRLRRRRLAYGARRRARAPAGHRVPSARSRSATFRRRRSTASRGRSARPCPRCRSRPGWKACSRS